MSALVPIILSYLTSPAAMAVEQQIIMAIVNRILGARGSEAATPAEIGDATREAVAEMQTRVTVSGAGFDDALKALRDAQA